MNSLTAGTTTRWFGFNAGTSAGNQFGLGFSGLTDGSYEFRTYVVDSTTGANGGPRTLHRVHRPDSPPPPAAGRFSIAFGRSMWQVADTTSGTCVFAPRHTHPRGCGPRTRVARPVRRHWRRDQPTRHQPVDPRVRLLQHQRQLGRPRQPARQLRMARVSHSKNYKDMTTLSTAQQIDESCGSLDVLEGRGHQDAWGLFNFPNDKQDTASRAVVLSCFAFYRLYGSGVNDLSDASDDSRAERRDGRRRQVQQPRARLLSATGLGGKRYDLPSALAARVLQPAAGQYNLIQFYRFVDGQRGTLSDQAAWDCTSPDPRDHWVSRIEFYCWTDFLAVSMPVPAGDGDDPVDHRPRARPRTMSQEGHAQTGAALRPAW